MYELKAGKYYAVIMVKSNCLSGYKDHAFVKKKNQENAKQSIGQDFTINRAHSSAQDCPALTSRGFVVVKLFILKINPIKGEIERKSEKKCHFHQI